jgi:NAD(P)-dependent dehydrogenase (short-subunit alcohol dehydrogenase family)
VTYAKQGVTINAICPGPVATELRIHSNEILRREFEKTPRVGSDVEDRSSQSPVGRVGKPEDIAAAACYLASQNAWYVNGLNLSIDGGWAAM